MSELWIPNVQNLLTAGQRAVLFLAPVMACWEKHPIVQDDYNEVICFTNINLKTEDDVQGNGSRELLSQVPE